MLGKMGKLRRKMRILRLSDSAQAPVLIEEIVPQPQPERGELLVRERVDCVALPLTLSRQRDREWKAR
jgi:hypothetical protein